MGEPVVECCLKSCHRPAAKHVRLPTIGRDPMKGHVMFLCEFCAAQFIGMGGTVALEFEPEGVTFT